MKQGAPVAAILLAAGSSRRFEGGNKLLCEWNSKPLVRHVAEVLVASGVGRLVVATGFQADGVRRALDGLDFTTIHNEGHADGMGSTIACAVAALRPDEAVLIVPGDMPWIEASSVRRMLDLGSGGGIVVPHHGDRAGNPVLFPPDLKPELTKLQGDRGARGVITRHADRVIRLEVGEQELEDLDTLRDFRVKAP